MSERNESLITSAASVHMLIHRLTKKRPTHASIERVARCMHDALSAAVPLRECRVASASAAEIIINELDQIEMFSTNSPKVG